MVTLEQILDKVADLMMLNIHMFTPEDGDTRQTIYANQKTIRNGLVTTGVNNDQARLLLFKSEAQANYEDDLNTLSDIVNSLNTFYDANNELVPEGGIIENVSITISCPDQCPPTLPLIWLSDNQASVSQEISTYLYEFNEDGTVVNPLNLGQFLGLQNQKSVIDPDKAEEYLDTTVYELLPVIKTRQERIDDFFAEFEVLSGHKPNFITDEFGDISAPIDYTESHDISAAQDTPDPNDPPGIEEENSYITRLDITANAENSGKTLQTLRNKINEYLEDIDQSFQTNVEDERPEYEHKSDGYIKIRNLNQGIIVRKQEGDSIGLEKQVTNDLHENEQHLCHTTGGPSYLCDGFTISMWIKFLDKTSKGTLFNYANPLRGLDPKGFKLETYILNKDDLMETATDFSDDTENFPDDTMAIEHTWGQAALYYGLDLFTNTDSERFIRLVVRDHMDRFDDNPAAGRLYDSHIGIPGLPRNHFFVPEFGVTDGSDYNIGSELYLLTHTRVPIDFNEWFFVVANYNPGIDDTTSISQELLENPDYWRGNIMKDSLEYTHYSQYGARCKVEIISKTDLLRARGYKV
tara:strand:+ start:3154 stop:4890 length:1737 start_codon:yes stop_codon:yes gene_type:complete